MRDFLFAILSFLIIVAVGFGIPFLFDFSDSDFISQYGLWISVGVTLFVLFIFLLVVVPRLQANASGIDDPNERFKAENDARKTIAQIIGGAAILVGLWFSWQTINLNQEGQITERFTRAISQLGDEDLEVRLGGIYALERIARDSEKDRWQIMEVLTAFVRENAPLPAKADMSKDTQAVEQKSPIPPEFKSPESQINKEGPESCWVSISPRTDIQAILTVIGRREPTSGKGEEQQLNLSRTFLKGANLGEANLQADFGGANLQEAHLGGVDLRGARSLTLEQLSEVKTLYEAELDPQLMGQVKGRYPHLLEEPEWKRWW